MLTKAGWRSIRLLRGAVYYQWVRVPVPAGVPEGLGPEAKAEGARRSVEAIAKQMTKVGVLLGSGEVLNAEPALLLGQWLEARSFDVSPYYGSLGSGYVLDRIADLEPWQQERELRLRYGPFLGCPILLDEKEVARAMLAAYPGYDGLVTDNVQLDKEVDAIFALEAGGPGRRAYKDGLVRKAVLEEFRKRYPDGMRRGQYDNIYAEAKVWIQENHDVSPSTTTVRGYLAPLRN